MGLLVCGGFQSVGNATFIANTKQAKHTQAKRKHFTYKKYFKLTLYRRVMALDFRGYFIPASLKL